MVGEASRLWLYANQLLNESSSLWLAPIVCPDHHSHQTALPIDDVGCGSPPDAPVFSGHVSALVEQHRSDVSPFLNSSFHEIWLLPDIHQENLQALFLEFLVNPVNGRQLLPAVWSPGCPEKDQDHLALEVRETNRLALEVWKRQGRRRFGRLVWHNPHRREVRPCPHDRCRQEQRE